jgi:hypothetical protein
MSRRLPEELEGKKLVPLCLTDNSGDARKVELILDKNDIDYTFEITGVTGGFFSIMFGGFRNGVMFLVQSDQYELCRSMLEKAKLSYLLFIE